MDYRHVVFPELSSDLYRSRQQRVAQTLDQIQSALGKEKRDLQREADGGQPIEGAGVEVTHSQPNLPQMANEPINSPTAVGLLRAV